MVRRRIKQRLAAVPAVRQGSSGVEWLLKRGLATLLWLVLRSGLHPLRYRRANPITAGRFYLEQFLRHYAPQCRGVFLEFESPRYRELFDPQAIERYDIVDIAPSLDTTIVADIQNCPQIPDASYDVIVCTQVLEHVPEPMRAVAELHRILKPDGWLLLTVPAVYPYHADPHDYWRFTRESLTLLLRDRFRDVTYSQYGNPLTVVAAYWFWLADHLPRRALQVNDPTSPILLAAAARK